MNPCAHCQRERPTRVLVTITQTLRFCSEACLVLYVRRRYIDEGAA